MHFTLNSHWIKRKLFWDNFREQFFSSQWCVVPIRLQIWCLACCCPRWESPDFLPTCCLWEMSFQRQSGVTQRLGHTRAKKGEGLPLCAEKNQNLDTGLPRVVLELLVFMELCSTSRGASMAGAPETSGYPQRTQVPEVRFPYKYNHPCMFEFYPNGY